MCQVLLLYKKDYLGKHKLMIAKVELMRCTNIYVSFYCAFHKHANSEVQNPTDDCVFRFSLNRPLRKQNFTLTGSKGQGL